MKLAKNGPFQSSYRLQSSSCEMSQKLSISPNTTPPTKHHPTHQTPPHPPQPSPNTAPAVAKHRPSRRQAPPQPIAAARRVPDLRLPAQTQGAHHAITMRIHLLHHITWWTRAGGFRISRGFDVVFRARDRCGGWRGETATKLAISGQAKPARSRCGEMLQMYRTVSC